MIAAAPEPQLDLCFALRGGQTVLARRHVSYPFHVGAPLAGAEVMVQSVSGGLFGNDRLGQRIVVGAGGAAVIRMPSAPVVHGMRDKAAARLTVTLRAAEGARLAYLPRPVILLPGSGLVQSMEVTVGDGARVLLQDGFLIHDPVGSAPAGRFLDSRVAVVRADGRRVARDRMRVTDAMLDAAAPGVAGGYRAFGTIWLLQDIAAEDYGRLRATLSPLCGPDVYGAITSLREGSGALIRLAARDGGALDGALSAITRSMALP
jgi:urease accessory protein